MFNHRCQVCAWGVAGDEGLLGGAGAAHAELLLRHEEPVIHHPAFLPHHTLLAWILNFYINTWFLLLTLPGGCSSSPPWMFSASSSGTPSWLSFSSSRNSSVFRSSWRHPPPPRRIFASFSVECTSWHRRADTQPRKCHHHLKIYQINR